MTVDLHRIILNLKAHRRKVFLLVLQSPKLHPKSFLTRPSEPSRNKKSFEKSTRKSNKAMVPCPFLKDEPTV